MSRNQSPSLAISGIPPDVLQRALERAKADGWFSKNALFIELLRDYGDRVVTPRAAPPAQLKAGDAIIRHQSDKPSLYPVTLVSPDGKANGQYLGVATSVRDAIELARPFLGEAGTVHLVEDGAWRKAYGD